MYSQLADARARAGSWNWQRRTLLRFPAVWLRDNCPCAQCLDPGTGQKLHDITDIPEDLTVAAVGGRTRGSP